MAVEIKIPRVGESVLEVTIAQWFFKDGDYVKKDAAVAEIESDKVNAEVIAPEGGILRVGASEGDVVAVGAIVGTIEEGSAPAEAAKPAAEAKKEDAPATAAASAPAANGPKATPLARKVAEDLGVDLKKVEGHGSGGKIVKEDVIAAASKPAAPAVAAPAPAAKAPVAGSREITREKMSTLRKRIATRLVEAQHTAAILTTFNEVDMSAVMDLRTKFKEGFQKKHGVGLGFMSFFVKACIEALKTYPRVNAYIENDEIVYHHYHDLGVAVGTEKGLVVPVIRNAEALSFAGIEKAIKVYGEKARDGKLTVDDLTGGTFTISNGGVYGSMMSTPILNPPQSGILGMHNIVRRPIAVGDQVVIRPMMYLALSYDHRIVDGKEAVGFLVRVKECIESPERLLLEI
ncbi:2-oxoglutarate dehydrogenase complex dihydrolipoyllysine-residue succinyltransferase [bacterium]|nr:2-oxoglutarate dehydrogenase complex dihydrolipoyllysine-residue succinyltransferase [bacterium]